MDAGAEIVPAGVDGENRRYPQQQQADLGDDRHHLVAGFAREQEADRDQLVPVVTQIGLLLLWISAIFTIYTGYDYFRAGIHHLIKEDEG